MKPAAAAVLIVAALLTAGWFATMPRGSDDEQIHRLIRNTEAAVNNRNLQKAMAAISVDYAGEGGTRNEVRLVLLQVFRESQEVRVSIDSIEPPRISATGDSASLNFAASVRVIGQGVDTQFATAAELGLRKESHRRLLIYPVREWRVIRAKAKTAVSNLF